MLAGVVYLYTCVCLLLICEVLLWLLLHPRELLPLPLLLGNGCPGTQGQQAWPLLQGELPGQLVPTRWGAAL